MSFAGDRLGPGPASLNIRETEKTEKGKISSLKTTIPLEQRTKHIGSTFPSEKYPGANQYKPKETRHTASNTVNYREP